MHPKKNGKAKKSARSNGNIGAVMVVGGYGFLVWMFQLLAGPPGPGTDQMQPELVAPMAAFLAHAALEAGEHQAGEGSDALQLMTVHSAKGLEFQAVFVTGLEEGLFPHEQSRNEDDGLEEERRLMYVAITRARSRLYLSFAQNRMLHGQTRYNVASRFLDEIPAGLGKRLTPRLGGLPPPPPVSPSAPGVRHPRSMCPIAATTASSAPRT